MSAQTLIPKIPEKSDVDLAIKLLKSKGYRVLPPLKTKTQVSNSEVLTYFYFEMESNIGSSYGLLSRGPSPEDKKALKAYQVRAKKFGLSAREANYELMLILKMFFKHYSKIGLQNPPNSLKCLLSSSGSWILQKALTLQEAGSRGNSEEFDNKIEALCNEPSDKFLELKKSRRLAMKNLEEANAEENND